MTLPDIHYPTFADVFSLSGDYRFTTEPVSSDTTTHLPTEVVTGLIDFIPRVPKGFNFYVNNFPAEGNNEIQLVGFVGVPGSGTFKVGYPATSPTWSANIPFNASAATFQATVEAVPTIGTGNISVTLNDLDEWIVEFINAKANTDVSLLQCDSTNLVGGTAQAMVDTAGHAVVLRDTSIALDPVFNARIWEGRLSVIDVTDTPGFNLPAASAAVLSAIAGLPQAVRQELNMPTDQLIYDVRHKSVVFARSDQTLFNYAIAAPAIGASVCLTDPDLVRLAYMPRPDVPTS